MTLQYLCTTHPPTLLFAQSSSTACAKFLHRRGGASSREEANSVRWVVCSGSQGRAVRQRAAAAQAPRGDAQPSSTKRKCVVSFDSAKKHIGCLFSSGPAAVRVRQSRHEGTRERVPTSLSTFSGGTTGKLSTTITLSKPRSSSCAARGSLGEPDVGGRCFYSTLMAWSTRRVTAAHVEARRLRGTLCIRAPDASGAAPRTRTPPKTHRQSCTHARTALTTPSTTCRESVNTRPAVRRLFTSSEAAASTARPELRTGPIAPTHLGEGLDVVVCKFNNHYAGDDAILDTRATEKI